jgi:hypothetical protein
MLRNSIKTSEASKKNGPAQLYTASQLSLSCAIAIQLPLLLGMAESGPLSQLSVFQRRTRGHKILDDLACCVIVERAFELDNPNDDKCSVVSCERLNSCERLKELNEPN